MSPSSKETMGKDHEGITYNFYINDLFEKSEKIVTSETRDGLLWLSWISLIFTSISLPCPF